MQDFLNEYTDTVNQVRAISRFSYCHRNRIPAAEMKLIEVLINNMRNCMEANLLSDARRHASYAKNIIDRVFHTSN